MYIWIDQIKGTSNAWKNNIGMLAEYTTLAHLYRLYGVLSIPTPCSSRVKMPHSEGDQICCTKSCTSCYCYTYDIYDSDLVTTALIIYVAPICYGVRTCDFVHALSYF